MHVGDTVLPLEDPGALQLDVLGSEVVEETAPLAKSPLGSSLVGPPGDCTTPSSVMNWVSVSFRMASPFPYAAI